MGVSCHAVLNQQIRGRQFLKCDVHPEADMGRHQDTHSLQIFKTDTILLCQRMIFGEGDIELLVEIPLAEKLFIFRIFMQNHQLVKMASKPAEQPFIRAYQFGRDRFSRKLFLQDGHQRIDGKRAAGADTDGLKAPVKHMSVYAFHVYNYRQEALD